MCTAVTYQTRDHYFGRTLDLEYSYHETVTITPRRFPLSFRAADTLSDHRAMIGMAYVTQGYPLYYDAVNEAGLCMAGLNFPGNAVYHPQVPGRDNVAPFELIPWVLGRCSSAEEARLLLERVNLTHTPFRSDLPLTPLHWLLADRDQAFTVEPLADGLHLSPNPVGVLTNSPPFDCQLFHLNQFLALSPEPPENRFSDRLDLTPYSRGMGAVGLPGDLSSLSRFVRAAFTRLNSVSGSSESDSLSQFFHILGSVEQPRGCVRVENGQYVITRYISCCNADRGIYYYTTYENRQITGVDLHREELDGSRLISYPLITGQQIRLQNAAQAGSAAPQQTPHP